MSSALHVIVGLGATGLACVRYLQQIGVNNLAVTDTRLHPPQLDALKKNYPHVSLSLGQLDSTMLAQAAEIIVSPGVALTEPAIAKQIQRGISVIGDIELFVRAVQEPVIAITGTNAKSTVTTLVGKMVAAAGYGVKVGGNLGVPALDLLMDDHASLVQRPSAGVFVLELSSFQLETTYSLRARVATILNVTPDHLDRYGSFAQYQQAKHRIYQHCQLAIYNRDDVLTDTVTAPQKLAFTSCQPAAREFGLLLHDGDVYLAFEDRPLLCTRELPIPGQHYQINALAALAIGYGFGLPFAPMLQVLREFTGLPHRCQFVRKRHGVSWYNDSKGTNVGATQAAIAGLGGAITGKLVLIAGGVGKNADFLPLVAVIKQYAHHVILLGAAAKQMDAILNQCVTTSFASSMADAVQQADQLASEHDVVLLSPACASFDMFKNFEHRGEVFMEMVANLSEHE